MWLTHDIVGHTPFEKVGKIKKKNPLPSKVEIKIGNEVKTIINVLPV